MSHGSEEEAIQALIAQCKSNGEAKYPTRLTRVLIPNPRRRPKDTRPCEFAIRVRKRHSGTIAPVSGWANT
jgi:hypothetical protein